MAFPSRLTRQERYLKTYRPSHSHALTPTKIFDRFSFTIHARVLKRAIAGLSDPGLNPSGLGLMEVCSEGFELTAYRDCITNGQVFGFLSLKATGLRNFVCDDHTEKMISLINIHTYLQRTADDSDLITVYSVEGTRTVCFAFRKIFCGDFPRDFELEIPFEYSRNARGRSRKFPTFSYGFAMAIPTNELEEALNNILQQHRREAGLEIDMGEFVVMFPHSETLRKTISLSQECTVWIGYVPDSNIVVLRYEMAGELGVFLYLKYANAILRLGPPIGTFWHLFAR